MVFNRRKYARKKFPRRKYTRAAITNKRIAKVAKRAVRRIAEKKFYLREEIVAVTNSGVLYDLSNTTQGDTVDLREGDKIIPTSLELDWYTVIADSTQFMRVIVFRWKNNDASDAPSISKLFQDVTYPYMAPYIHDTRDQFDILCDVRYTLDSYHPVKLQKKVCSLAKPIHYNQGQTSGLGKIYIYLISDSSVSIHPTIVFYSKLNYTDF